MKVPPLFVTRANIGFANDTAMLSFSSPSGPIENGVVLSEEAARLIVSFGTLREIAKLLNQKVAELDAADVARAAEIEAAQVKRAVERRSLRDEQDAAEAITPRLQ